jgi:ABC-2 type transport system ATP-binding protein
VSLRFAEPAGLSRAARVLDATADDDALTLRVANDGTVAALRILLDRLDSADVAVEELQVHTPDLDDVFLALTGPKKETVQ